jgi:GNAT superfamily N-acetyltransferase
VQPFDYDPPATVHFYPWEWPDVPTCFGLGVIVGASGSGKSLLVRDYGHSSVHDWGPRPILDHFEDPALAPLLFYAAGLSSVPVWCLPYAALSTGQRFRADLARSLEACYYTNAYSPAVVDEFSSVVDRTVARACCAALSRAHDKGDIGRVVLATCHRDILNWLRPDWIIDTDAGQFIVNPKERLQRAGMVASVYRVDREVWRHFVGHHYLNGDDLHPFARCYVATVGEHPAAFGAAIPFPHGSIHNAWRGTRTVTLPDYQGLGLGVRLSDWIAEAHVRAGYRYFSRTSHPRMGEYRERHPNWRATSSNRTTQTIPEPGASSIGKRLGVDGTRVAYSHEYQVTDNQ